MSAPVLYTACAGFLAGLALLFFISTLTLAAGFLFVAGVSLCVGKLHKAGFLVAVFLCAAVLGMVRTEFFIRAEAGSTLTPFVERTAHIEGTVVGEPEVRTRGLFTYIGVETLNGEPRSGTVLATLPNDTEVAVGDYVRVRGLLEEPQAFETDTGRTFDYPGYLRVRGVTALMPYATVLEVQEGGPSFYTHLYTLKHTFERGIQRMFDEPASSLLLGILLGERRGLPDALTEAFIITGLIHIVVLSGYNIAIVAESILRMLRAFAPRGLALFLGALAMIAFALMVGAGAATVRATLMGLIALLARYLRRPSVALRSLVVAIVVMAGMNPPALLFDPGFILSALATFGLITLGGTVENHITFVPERFGLRSIAASTLAVQMFLLPALLYMSGILSFLSLPANVFVLPLVPSIMLFGFLAGVLALVHPLVAAPIALACNALLFIVLFVAERIAALPGSYVVVPAFPAYVLLLAYAPLAYVAAYLYRKN